MTAGQDSLSRRDMPGLGRERVDDVLLAGGPHEVCLELSAPVTREELRAEVVRAEEDLRAAGGAPGGCVALWLPPSLAYVSMLLGAWRLGAQVILLDHRLTPAEVDGALDRVSAQVVVSAEAPASGALTGYADVTARARPRPGGRPAATSHALVQLSSGSTGASKVVGRRAEGLMAELERFARLPGMPGRGERLVLLNSLVHSLGLVGGLLHGLRAGVETVLPRRHTARAILAAIGAGRGPVTVLGVPFHAELLAAVERPPHLPELARVALGGEPTRPAIAEAFADRYGLTLGDAYGMTEVGIIAADLDGRHRPATGPPAPGMQVREQDGELWVRCDESPYLGDSEPGRYADGWLRTNDAGTVDTATGLVTVHGRLDSQVAIGGTKVDLAEVEHTLADLDGVEEAVVVHDGAIRAYAALEPGVAVADVEAAAAQRLAAFKRPHRLEALERLPRTASGKLVRDPERLREAAGRERPASR